MTNSTTDLWQQVTSHDALHAAWARVDSNEGSAGGDGVHRAEFRNDLFARLTALRADLLSGRYASRPFRKVAIPKKKPGYRVLTIPSIRDRIVHTSIARVLSPILEKTFEEGSFGYRPGRGVTHAVAKIEKWRDRGYEFVVEADIVRFFDNIDHELLMEKLERTIVDCDGAEPLLRLVSGIVTAQAAALGTEGRGLAQGSPLSPLLANLFLDALDEEIDDRGVKIVRFADDFVILCKSKKKAEKALSHCIEVLDDHGLELHQDGTRIVNFDKGFDFVGYLFMRTLALKGNKEPTSKREKVKSEVTDDGVIVLDEEGSRFNQSRKVLYVLDPANSLHVRNKSFSVRRGDDAELLAVSNRRVARIEIGDDIDYSRGAIALAMEANIPLSVVDFYGQTKGYVLSRDNRRAGVQFAQAKAVMDEDFRLAIARLFVVARIRNQRTQLARLNRSKKVAETDLIRRDLKRLLHDAMSARSVKKLMGLEGAACAAYWPCLGAFHEQAVDAPFRRQRPARDILNACINYLTGMLERDSRASIQRTGLNTGFAFLHGVRDRHDGLVFDFMEPFRAALTEGLPIFLLNSRRLRDEMFSQSTDGLFDISLEGRRALVEGYETAVARSIQKPEGGARLTWRMMMTHIAYRLKDAVERNDPELFMPLILERKAA